MNSHTLNPMTNTFLKSATGNVAPRSLASPKEAEVHEAKNPTEKPLSPETQEGLKRWNPKENPYNVFNSDRNNHKLPDYLQHPVRNLTNVVSFVGTAIMGLIGAFHLYMADKIKNLSTGELKKIGYASHKEFKSAGYISAVAILLEGGLGLWLALQIQNTNKDTLQGIQILGEKATRQDWINYKKAHPEITKS